MLIELGNPYLAGALMGENCAPLLEKFSDKYDMTMTLSYNMPLNPEHTKNGFLCLNTGEVLKTKEQYLKAWQDGLCAYLENPEEPWEVTYNDIPDCNKSI